jgi:hypothetical protein
MSHYSLKFPKMKDFKRLSTRQYPNIVVGSCSPTLSLPAPPPINQIFQDAPVHSSFQSSHASKRLRTKVHHDPGKGKDIAAPSSPSNGFDKSVSSHMHLRDDFSHVINKILRIASQSGKYGF